MRTRAEKQAIDRNPANKCHSPGCGNTRRLGEDYCGLHLDVCSECGESNVDEATELCEMCFDWVFGTTDGFQS